MTGVSQSIAGLESSLLFFVSLAYAGVKMSNLKELFSLQLVLSAV